MHPDQQLLRQRILLCHTPWSVSAQGRSLGTGVHPCEVASFGNEEQARDMSARHWCTPQHKTLVLLNMDGRTLSMSTSRILAGKAAASKVGMEVCRSGASATGCSIGVASPAGNS